MMTAVQLASKYPALYTTLEFITVFTADVTGAYPSQINPIRLVTTHFLKANLALPLGISGGLKLRICK